MSPQVTAAVIAAGVSFLTLIGTLAAQYFGRRATSRDTQKAFDELSTLAILKVADERVIETAALEDRKFVQLPTDLCSFGTV